MKLKFKVESCLHLLTSFKAMTSKFQSIFVCVKVHKLISTGKMRRPFPDTLQNSMLAFITEGLAPKSAGFKIYVAVTYCVIRLAALKN